MALPLLATPALADTASPLLRVSTRDTYEVGKPLVIAVKVCNASTMLRSVLAPDQKGTLFARVKHAGEDGYLARTRFTTYLAHRQKRVALKPRQCATGTLDVSRLFRDQLPPGRYLVEITYIYGDTYAERTIASPVPMLIVANGNKESVRRGR